MLYSKNRNTIFTIHNSTFRSIWIHITQLLVSFWESAWSFVIIPLYSLICTIQYLADSPRDCGYVVNNPLSPIMSHPHCRNVCYFFQGWTHNSNWVLCLPADYCCGIFSRSDMKMRVLKMLAKSAFWEGDWLEEVYISTLLACLLWCDTFQDCLRHSKCVHQ